ncbi:hypothetical protein DFH94DRAFT_680556 [Russula ochroleuca]|uniref:Ankyrin n=1 Tax=Russula ochroleuca TaxID=152965 RepID=A0A9P5TAV3_9AGAM|nr:hypothetical protein DFH94DRAFT_680556 [Russula ochroleuca]
MPTSSRHHKAEAKFNVTTEFPHLGLHSAAATGNIGLVKYAISHGQPINSVIDGVLPLHAACSGGSDMVVRLLIDNGADVNASRLPRRFSDKTRCPSAPIIGTSGSTPLHFAAANGHTEVVLTLLRHGARPDRADKRGVTPEILARQHGWLACADAIRDWIANKDRDLLERETRLSGIPLDDPDPISQSRERHGSLCACEGPECMSTHVIPRLCVKRSIENAILLFRPGTSPQDGAIPMPDDNWPPPESPDLPPSVSSRRPSLPQSDEPLSTRPSYGRPRRPSSAGNGAERPHHHHSRRLGSKYSLLNLFRKSSTEMLSTHSTPGGATPDVNMGTGTSNTTSSPTSPLSSSPSTFALELNGLGQDGSPPARSSMLRSNGVSSGSSSGVPSVSIPSSQHPQTSRSLRFNSSEPNVSSRGKSPRRAALGSSPGHDGRLSEESEDEDEEYGIEAVRSRMMTGEASTQDIDFPFSIDVPVEDELPGLSDVRGRGDSLSTNLSATTASTSSLRTPSALPTILPSTSEDVKLLPHAHRPPPLTGLSATIVSTQAEAEALVAHARGQVLTAREGDDIPLSARLAALGESLRLERKFKEAKESVTPIERRASEGTALDTADAESWEQDKANGKTRSASVSAGAGTDRNLSLDYRVGHSWRGRSRRPITNESALSSDDGLLVPHPDPDMHVIHHRSRSAAPAHAEGDMTRAVRTPIHSPRLARAPSLDQPSFTEATAPSPGIKSAPLATTSPTPISRSRTPDPNYERGVPLTRIVTAPPQESPVFNYVVPSPVVDVVVRRGNERAQAVSRANKLARMGFAPEVKVLSTGAATPPGHGHGHGHRFGIRSLVQSLKGKS